MEDYIQFSAKTKSEAITKACIELGVSSDQLEIQVVSEGSNGFFGIGSKPAIIKVRKVEPVSEEEEMKEIVETVKLDSFKEEAPVQRREKAGACESSKEGERAESSFSETGKTKTAETCKGKTCKRKTAKEPNSSESKRKNQRKRNRETK